MMQGLMMPRQRLISSLLVHAERLHGDREIVTRTVEGPIHRYTYRDAAYRARQLANALTRLGVQMSDRIGTLAWNTHRHYEIYYAVSGMGAITHTINPRLFPEQISYIVNHAEDSYLLVDLSFVPLLEKLADQLRSVKAVIIMTDRAHMPQTTLPNVLCYEDLLAPENDQYEWPEFPEETACTLCYTSGTTGNPKGVLYSHRSTLLHAEASCRADALHVTPDSQILPVVPMFHVSAWGVPYAATLMGAKLIMPGAGLDGASLTQLIIEEQATLLLGVPTVWLGLLNHLRKENIRLMTVKNVVIGGSATPLAMIREFDEAHGAFVIHAWGMTELSPLGTANIPTTALLALPREERYQQQLKQGRAVFGIEIDIVDDSFQSLPRDGKSFGRLVVRGPWVASQYYKHEDRSAFAHGWFDTGDVATIDSHGYMQIVDRAKDVIKSGGEWISSIDLENAAMSHPGVLEACVIASRHPKWDERPLLLIIKRPDAELDEQAVLNTLRERVAKWWVPEAVLFVSELPHTATGKLSKLQLREKYGNYYMETEKA